MILTAMDAPCLVGDLIVTVRLVSTSEIGVVPARIRAHELDGIVFFTWPDSPAVGAQCGSCHSIVWVDQRMNLVLNEAKPVDVPESGRGYRVYQMAKIQRFLSSIPACPQCGSTNFDRFINNVTHPRFPNGKELPANLSSSDLIKEEGAVAVYLAE